ncbi:MAG: hypothetical protein IT303_11270 [Dehalococcoidia bacterium]|nr:hypothetical protein [Dehalococcoidia bacterium]
MLGMFGARGWALAALGAVATLVVIGLPVALIDNPVFGRQLAARDQDYVFWAITAVLGGLILGSYAVAPATGQVRLMSGGFLSTLAVGCPICNKVAVGLLGTSGALNVFGPSQLFIGIASVALLGWTLVLRAQSVAGACEPPRR